MGTWGTGPFDNDLAWEMVASLEDEGLDVVRAALTFPDVPHELDAICAAEVVAAAELVAAFLGRQADDLPEDAVVWVRGNQPEASEVAALRAASLPLIDIVLAENCELLQLWRENEAEFPKWRGRVDSLRSRLQ